MSEVQVMERVVTKIPQRIQPLTRMPLNASRKRRVAGYARVSTDSEEQENSYEAQVDYFTEYIRGRDDWTFVKIYTEEEHSYPVLYMDYPLSKRALLSLTVMSKRISWLRKVS